MLPLMAIPVVTQTLGLNQYIGQIPVVGPTFQSIMTNMNPMNMLTGMSGMASSLLGTTAGSSSNTETEVLLIAGAGLGLLFILK